MSILHFGTKYIKGALFPVCLPVVSYLSTSIRIDRSVRSTCTVPSAGFATRKWCSSTHRFLVSLQHRCPNGVESVVFPVLLDELHTSIALCAPARLIVRITKTNLKDILAYGRGAAILVDVERICRFGLRVSNGVSGRLLGMIRVAATHVRLLASENTK